MKNDDLPEWVRPSLQGLTYWIGHKRSFYRSYPLGESAFVGELCSLINSNLEKHYRLKCEVQFKKFIEGEERPTILTERARADIVVAKLISKKKLVAKHVVEVKRASSSAKSIESDLQRLAAVKESKENIRTFLVVVSETRRPLKYVNEKGNARRKPSSIKDTNCVYYVRRVYKATGSFSGIDQANYACLLEVVPK